MDGSLPKQVTHYKSENQKKFFKYNLDNAVVAQLVERIHGRLLRKQPLTLETEY